MRRKAAEFATRLRDEYEAGRSGEPVDDAELADAVRSVDWAAVRTATAERGGEVASAARAMAAEVDWQRLQPVAVDLSSALIAAVASGRLPLGGHLGGRLGAGVARAIMDDGVASRVANTLGGRLPDFSDVIDTSGREVPPADRA